MDRRTFLTRSLGGVLFRDLAPVLARDRSTRSTWITVVSRVGAVRHERVNVGLPFGPGWLDDASRVRVEDERGRALDAAVRMLEPWHGPANVDAGAPSIRSAQIQFKIDLDGRRPRRVRVSIGSPRREARNDLVPVVDTLVDRADERGPRVLPLIDAEWLCGSEIVGPQTPASADGPLAAYDRFVDRSFPASLQFLNSGVYHHWLFDRTSTYYAQYVRTGRQRFLDAAYHCARFMREHTALTPPNAGMFTLKGADVKYVYPRAMHVHYLLTGDERALEAGKVMARFCLTRWDPEYRPQEYVQPALGTDPEKDRKFWSTRHEAYGLLGVLHGWEMTGDEAYLRQVNRYIDALADHQEHPPDGRPPDGSWRQNWALYDPNETTIPAGASAWMTAILLSALFHAWRVTSDARIPGMVTRWCDFLDRKGFVADGSKAHYVIDCFGSEHLDDAGGPQEQGMERHSTELAYSFAMGHYFSRDPAQRDRFRARFNRLLAIATTIDANRPARCYNWAFQASSQLVYFMSPTRSRYADAYR